MAYLEHPAAFISKAYPFPDRTPGLIFQNKIIQCDRFPFRNQCDLRGINILQQFQIFFLIYMNIRSQNRLNTHNPRFTILITAYIQIQLIHMYPDIRYHFLGNLRQFQLSLHRHCQLHIVYRIFQSLIPIK